MDDIILHIFHTGKVRVDRAIPLHERNPLAVTGLLRSRKKQMLLPVSAYLIEHPEGKILIDTGWDTKYATERPKQLFGMVNKVSAPIIKTNDGAYMQSSFTEHKIPGFTVNNQLANKTLDWLIRCKADPSCIGVYVNHDPTVKEQKLEIQI